MPGEGLGLTELGAILTAASAAASGEGGGSGAPDLPLHDLNQPFRVFTSPTGAPPEAVSAGRVPITSATGQNVLQSTSGEIVGLGLNPVERDLGFLDLVTDVGEDIGAGLKAAGGAVSQTVLAAARGAKAGAEVLGLEFPVSPSTGPTRTTPGINPNAPPPGTGQGGGGQTVVVQAPSQQQSGSGIGQPVPNALDLPQTQTQPAQLPPPDDTGTDFRLGTGVFTSAGPQTGQGSALQTAGRIGRQVLQTAGDISGILHGRSPDFARRDAIRQEQERLRAAARLQELNDGITQGRRLALASLAVPAEERDDFLAREIEALLPTFSSQEAFEAFREQSLKSFGASTAERIQADPILGTMLLERSEEGAKAALDRLKSDDHKELVERFVDSRNTVVLGRRRKEILDAASAQNPEILADIQSELVRANAISKREDRIKARFNQVARLNEILPLNQQMTPDQIQTVAENPQTLFPELDIPVDPLSSAGKLQRDIDAGILSAEEAAQIEKSGATTFNVDLTPRAEGELQTRALDLAQFRDRLIGIDEAFRPELQGLGARMDARLLKVQDLLSDLPFINELDPEQKQFLDEVVTLQTRTATDLVRLLNELSGAAVSPAEAERIELTIPNGKEGPVVFRSKLDAALTELDTALAKYSFWERSGRPAGIRPWEITRTDVADNFSQMADAAFALLRKQFPDATDDELIEPAKREVENAFQLRKGSFDNVTGLSPKLRIGGKLGN